jgi:hypothetical protein
MKNKNMRRRQQKQGEEEQQQEQQQLTIEIRSDSKSTIEQLQGSSDIQDVILQRIFRTIRRFLKRLTTIITSCTILFNYLERTRNIAGLMLEQLRRKKNEEQQLTILSNFTFHNNHTLQVLT